MRTCLSLGARRPRPVALYAQMYVSSVSTGLCSYRELGLDTDRLGYVRPVKRRLFFRKLDSV